MIKQNFMDYTWEFNGQIHQLDPLTEIEKDGALIRLYILLDMPEDKAIEISKTWKLLNIKKIRDTLLKESDWTDLLSAKERLGEEYDEWQNYRQKLRDITINFNPFNEDIVWPYKPNMKVKIL